MTRKSVIAVMVFTLLFTATAGVSTAQNERAAEHAMAIAGQNHMAVQGTAWVAERPNKFLRFRPYAWGVMTRAKMATQEWVHIAVPTPTYIDDTQLKVFLVQFCASATRPKRSAPVAVHLWANNVRVHTESITWPDTTGQHCHTVNFSPAQWMESVGVSVLVKYSNDRHKVTLHKAWIGLVP